MDKSHEDNEESIEDVKDFVLTKRTFYTLSG